ncbi:MAG TPA: thioesterase family protein [Pirellulales bacterium]|jgi:4-hydroxybenzoyl-CoA thioesterase/acyl-CoA thioester hydrolase|nr:thioesterase family protein [Pirellulales bacterium]
MPEIFRTTRRIEFRDTDAAGIAHFSSFLVAIEQVEHAFLRSLGLSVLASDAEGPIGWPRVAVQCDFQGAARFEDVLDAELTIDRLGQKSITYRVRFAHRGRPVAEGTITAVYCRLDGGNWRSTLIPESIRELVRPFVSASSALGGPGTR